MPETRLRILLLAPEANPESSTTPVLGYEHAEALARRHTVTLVIRAKNLEPVRRAGGPFHAVVPIRLPWLDRLYAWALRRIFKYDYGRQSLTAAEYPYQVAFEWRAWRAFREKILSREFDIVLRILPVVSVLPSPFASFLRKGPIPFVIGPLNGGLPWPKGLRQLDEQRRNPGYWVHKLRGLYIYLPFARSTYANATAIIAGSSHTYNEFARYADKLFFVPGENGLLASTISPAPKPPRGADLELIFVGRLIPLKACDIALRAASPLLRDGMARMRVLGRGPQRPMLEQLVRSLGIQERVQFWGRLPHPEALNHIREADVMVFPSLREFGGAVVFEALALGTVPIVADFGGPGDIVDTRVGYKVPLVDEDTMVLELQAILKHLASDRQHLAALQHEAVTYARDYLTWDAKARMVTDVLCWATGKGPRPDLKPPYSMKKIPTGPRQ